MKILHLSSERGWRGGEVQLELLFRSLRDICEQKVAIPVDSELSSRIPEASAIQVRRLGLAAPMATLALLKSVRSWRPDILHAHTSKAFETALQLQLITGIPVVTSKRNAYAVRGKWKYRRANAVIAVSKAARLRLLEAGVEADRINVIHDAVDESRFAESHGLSGNRMPVVLCAAALSQEKGLDTLLSAWKILEEEGTAGTLLVAGVGGLEMQLRSQQAALNLKRVQFLGWRQDVPDLLAEADVAVLASREEGLSSFLCEAQWAGKPVVATGVGGIPEVVLDGETGLLCASGDANAFAKNLSRLLRDKDLREKMGTAAARRAHALFGIGKIASQHMAVYQALAS